jgi:hypothetical protein
MLDYNCALLRRLTVAGALLLPVLGYSQAASPSDSTTTTTTTTVQSTGASTRTDEAVTLSPFEVSANRDVGYQATQTLAGTRIATNLSDVGDAIQVATKEFINDINATNSTNLLQYMTNTEVGGIYGNYGGMGDGSVLNDSNQKLSPSNTTRVRGLDTADNTRDYFLTDIPWDSYNTSRIDIQRGANSILTGNGSGAGIINGTTDAAMVGFDQYVLVAQAGSYGSYRGSFNANISAGDQFAVRVAGLDDHEFYREKPSFDTNERKYVAARWNMKFLEKWGVNSSIRANYEEGKDNANRPDLTPPVDEITPWFLTAPRTLVTPNGATLGTVNPMVSHAGYNPFTVDISTASLIPMNSSVGAHVANNANSEGWLWPGTGNGVNGDWFSGFAAIYPQANSGTASYFINGGLNSIAGLPSGLRGPDMVNIVNFANYAQGRAFLYQSSGVYKATTISNPGIFNFYDNLLGGPNAEQTNDFHSANATWDVSAWHDRLGFEAAFDHQNYRASQASSFGGSPVLALDVWSNLPIAMTDSSGNLVAPANPNFGRPFTEGTPSGSAFQNVRQTERLAPYLVLDFPDLTKNDSWWMKILGRHSLSGIFEMNSIDARTSGWAGDSLDDATAQQLFGNSAVSITGTTRKLVTLSYLGSSVIGGSINGANIPGVTAMQNPVSGPAYYFNTTYNANAPAKTAPWPQGGVTGLAPNQTGLATANQVQGNNPANYAGWNSTTPVSVWSTSDGQIADLYTGQTQQKTVTSTAGFVDQWSIYDNLLVGTLGLRKDGVKTYTGAVASGNQLNANGSVNLANPLIYTATPSSQFDSELEKTYDVVLHSPAFVNKYLPWGMEISLFYNQSDNFRPESHVGIFGQALPPPNGKTKDRGFMISALQNRVELKMNWYISHVSGADLSDPGNGARSRIGDEVRRAIQFADDIQTHNKADGYQFTDTADPTDTALYAYQPATGTSATWTKADWQAAEVQAQADAAAVLKDVATDPLTQAIMKSYQINPATYSATNTTINYTIPTGLQITSDTLSKGTEVELTLRPTDNWNIAFDASRTFATRTNLASSVTDWIVQRWDLYNAENSAASPGLGEMRWFGGSQGNQVSSSGLARFGRNAWAFFNQFEVLQGTNVPELRPYAFNLISTYHLSRGPAKGAFLGGAWRWQDKSVDGFDVMQITPALSPSNPAIGAFNPAQPYHGPSDSHIDLWVGYERKLKKVDWKIQLNVRNAFDRVGLVPINTNPDGSIASYRIQDGATWSVTNTFTF